MYERKRFFFAATSRRRRITDFSDASKQGIHISTKFPPKKSTKLLQSHYQISTNIIQNICPFFYDTSTILCCMLRQIINWMCQINSQIRGSRFWKNKRPARINPSLCNGEVLRKAHPMTLHSFETDDLTPWGDMWNVSPKCTPQEEGAPLRTYMLWSQTELAWMQMLPAWGMLSCDTLGVQLITTHIGPFSKALISRRNGMKVSPSCVLSHMFSTFESLPRGFVGSLVLGDF